MKAPPGRLLARNRGKWIAVLALICQVTALSGCAAPVLTPDEEAAFRKNCTDGCVVVPVPLWEKVIERLKGVMV